MYSLISIAAALMVLIAPAGVSLSGKVTDAQGGAVADANVRVGREDGTVTRQSRDQCVGRISRRRPHARRLHRRNRTRRIPAPNGSGDARQRSELSGYLERTRVGEHGDARRAARRRGRRRHGRRHRGGRAAGRAGNVEADHDHRRRGDPGAQRDRAQRDHPLHSRRADPQQRRTRTVNLDEDSRPAFRRRGDSRRRHALPRLGDGASRCDVVPADVELRRRRPSGSIAWLRRLALRHQRRRRRRQHRHASGERAARG